MLLKRFIALFLAAMLLLSFVACNATEDPHFPNENNNSATDGSQDDSGDATDSDSDNDQEQSADSEGQSGEDSDNSDESDIPDIEELVYPWAEVPETLKVLAIGNSFSVDAMEYLYNIAKNAGVKTIVLGNLRVSGCTVSMHYDYARGSNQVYEYFKNTDGTWRSTPNSTIYDGILDENWDYITLQQGSPESGLPEKFRHLENLANIVNNKKTNPNAKLIWHMTWAYQQDSTHAAFTSYDSNQETMYNAIINTVKEKVLPLDIFSAVIPSGTAVQNARTSFIGDNMTRDGYHMVQPFGRYLVGLTYFAAITGADISNISYRPSASITDEMVAMAKESVKNAMLNMYGVTESTYKTSEEKEEEKIDSNDPKDYFVSDAKLAKSIGVDLSGYTLFEYEYLTNMYYNSTSNIKPNSASSSQNEKHICFKERYTKEQLLNAIIICDAGWQYRPEQWDTADGKASVRPVMCSEPIDILDEDFWSNNVYYFALNISANPQRSLAANYAEAAPHVRIYIPTK